MSAARTNIELAKIQYRKVHAMRARHGASEAITREAKIMRAVLANLFRAERYAFDRWQTQEANPGWRPRSGTRGRGAEPER